MICKTSTSKRKMVKSSCKVGKLVDFVILFLLLALNSMYLTPKVLGVMINSSISTSRNRIYYNFLSFEVGIISFAILVQSSELPINDFDVYGRGKLWLLFPRTCAESSIVQCAQGKINWSNDKQVQSFLMLLMTLECEDVTIFKKCYMGIETHSELMRCIPIFFQ
jgi:hypothetical protein